MDSLSGNNNKMEGEGAVKTTLDCLRGRLLAERQASRAAKEDAELMGNKLIELENKLKEEINLRRKAEKKLRFLKKKLESLNINSPSLLEGSELMSSSSHNCGFSCTSSCSLGHKDPEESEEAKSLTTSSQDLEATSVLNQNHSTPPGATETSTTTSTTLDTSDSNSNSLHKEVHLDNCSNDSTPSFQDSEPDYNSSSSLKASVEMETNARNESDNEDNVDNSLALVAVSVPASEKKILVVNKSVAEVLEALRHAREQIQNSMETRHIIRVGPT
ncbi:hypothetical protein Tsubulata_016753 [Turnera subulata]|uniref:Uncharacterized protein n=1 Tax=Turnera subulata TaxID=218843 RepID=A0A9Q0FHG9_9ROSI|nr:hypothetical protein Tsubulata_016753 [Turnera subulata]